MSASKRLIVEEPNNNYELNTERKLLAGFSEFRGTGRDRRRVTVTGAYIYDPRTSERLSAAVGRHYREFTVGGHTGNI